MFTTYSYDSFFNIGHNPKSRGSERHDHFWRTFSLEWFTGRMSGGRMSVYAKKFEILQKETTNWAVLCDCMPVIMDLMTCELNVNKMLLKSVLQNLVQSLYTDDK